MRYAYAKGSTLLRLHAWESGRLMPLCSAPQLREGDAPSAETPPKSSCRVCMVRARPKKLPRPWRKPPATIVPAGAPLPLARIVLTARSHGVDLEQTRVPAPVTDSLRAARRAVRQTLVDAGWHPTAVRRFLSRGRVVLGVAA